MSEVLVRQIVGLIEVPDIERILWVPKPMMFL